MRHIQLLAALVLATAILMPAQAQVSITEDQAPVLLTAFDTRTIGWKTQTFSLPLQTNIDELTATTSAAWLSVRVQNKKVYVTAALNEKSATRTGKVTVKGGGLTKDIIVTQEGARLEDDVLGTYEFNLFDDVLCTRLKPEVTPDDIKRHSNLFVRKLAQALYDGTYDFTYRTGTFECLPDPKMLGRAWGTGKSYDIVQGVTGIMVRPGRFIVAVEGVPEEGDFSAQLCLYQWKVPESQGCKHQEFKLKNGLHILESILPENALAYVSYFSETPDDFPPVKIHIIDGIQNGFLTPEMSNDSCYQLLQSAPCATMDLVGERVHSVWETQALMQYTKGKYRKMINTMDTLLCWIHRLTGLEKYNMIPRNKSLAYVNYDYYMYQGGLGVSFKYDQQFRTLNPDRLLKSDSDCIWGYSHEWGHQHQISPYLCWGGMSETTNNINSAYNVLHLGYRGDNIHNELGMIRQWFLTGSRTGVSTPRRMAYEARSKYKWNAKMYAMYESMQDSTMHRRDENFERAQALPEAYPNAYTTFWAIHEYMTKYVYEDFTPDLYHAMRETNRRDEKYAILAAAQNGVKGKWDEFREKFPTSCWVEDGYVNASSTVWDNSVPYIMNFVMQASLISGYNLFGIYDELGYLRTIAMLNDDYGKKYYCMTPEMKAEFRADMEALEANGTLKPFSKDNLKDILADKIISSYPTPDIPN